MIVIYILLLIVCADSDPVLNQYTEYPYPEFSALHLQSESDHYGDSGREGPHMVVPDLTLENLNHYLYQGDQDFLHGFRVLIAGGGIGDTTMFLAEQLNHTDAEIVYLDFSPASLNIAQERAAIRNLTNIRFINDRIENIPNLDLGLFDFIDSYGVIHHLKEPLEALRILQKCLKEEGGMTIMLYAQYGRTGVYNMQALQQLVNDEVISMREEVRNAWKILDSLPPTNLFKRTEHLATDHLRAGDAGLYDMLLHKQDKAFTIPHMLEMVNMSALHFAGFSEPDERLNTNYRWFIKDSALLKNLDRLSVFDQMGIGEILSGNIMKHSFYLTNRIQNKDDLDVNKSLCFMGKEETFNQFMDIKEKEFGVRRRTIDINFLDYINHHVACTKTINDMLLDINKELKTESYSILLNELISFFNFFSDIGQLLIRKKGIGPSKLSIQFNDLFDSFYTFY